MKEKSKDLQAKKINKTDLRQQSLAIIQEIF
jgi:hypothetical protein